MSYAGALPGRPQINTGYGYLDKPIRFVTTLWWLLIQIPADGIKIFPPVFLLAISAAYASAQFAAHRGVFPEPLNWAQAIAFEWVYIGTLRMAASQKGRWFFVVLLAGAATSVIYIVLYAASQYGIMGQVRALLPATWYPFVELAVTLALILAHGVPLTAVNVVYGFLIDQYLRERQFPCPYGCGAAFRSEPALRGHKGQCKHKV
jgi:hypothetical protein